MSDVKQDPGGTLKQIRYRYGARRRISWDDGNPDEKKTEYKCIKCCKWFSIDAIIFQDGSQYCRGCMLIRDSTDIQAWAGLKETKVNEDDTTHTAD